MWAINRIYKKRGHVYKIFNPPNNYAVMKNGVICKMVDCRQSDTDEKTAIAISKCIKFVYIDAGIKCPV